MAKFMLSNATMIMVKRRSIGEVGEHDSTRSGIVLDLELVDGIFNVT